MSVFLLTETPEDSDYRHHWVLMTLSVGGFCPVLCMLHDAIIYLHVNLLVLEASCVANVNDSCL